MKRVKAHLDEILEYKYSIGYDGEQNSGKTFTMTYDGIYLAPFKYSDLLFAYYLDYPSIDELKADEDQYRYKLYKAKEESIEFYNAHEDKIPCFYSNYEVQQYFRKNYKLKREHIIFDRRLPESAVGCGDEFANMFGNELRRKAKPEEDDLKVNSANEFASLHRQYADFTLLTNDQRLGEIFNGFRTCMGLRRHLETKEERYSPKLFMRIRDYYHKKIMKLGTDNTKKLRAKWYYWDNLVCRIGFLKIGYTKETGIVGNEKKEKELQYYSLGKDIDFSYKHRGEFVNYPALGKKF